MGSAKSIQKTREIECIVPAELRELCSKIRSAMNCLEAKLDIDFPGINDETAISRYAFQQAFYNYCERLSEARAIEDIGKSGSIQVPGSYIKLIPDFIKYLERFGEVGISSCVFRTNGLERAGIFLARMNEPRLIGFLEIQQNPDQIEYRGYVPISVSEREFHKSSIFQLSLPPDLGINLAYVRLFCEMKGGKPVRIDGYGDKGIDFP